VCVEESENAPVSGWNFVCVCSDEPLLTHDTMSHVIDIVAKHGTDAWWSMSVEELLPARFKADAERCTHLFAYVRAIKLSPKCAC
jgi:isoleucyl-tRNA synthetase